MINFARGHPNKDLLPKEFMQEVLLIAASTDNQDRLQNSLDYLQSDKGDPELLSEINSFLERHTTNDQGIEDLQIFKDDKCCDDHDYDGKSDDDDNYDNCYDDVHIMEQPTMIDMFVTHGVSHGLDMLCTAQTRPGDVVMVENPTYFLVGEIFRSHGLTIQYLPMKEARSSANTKGGSGSGSGSTGVDVDRLQIMIQTGKISPPRMIYVIPAHQNPTGRCMSLADRCKLTVIAKRYGILVAADEVYHLLDWRDLTTTKDDHDCEDVSLRPARMAVLDSQLQIHHRPQHGETKSSTSPSSSSSASTTSKKLQGCCVTVSSFTKIFAPGIRCGWIEGPKYIIDSLVDVGYIQSQGGCTPFIGELLRISLSKRIGDKILSKLNEDYKYRSNYLCNLLEQHEGIRIDTRPCGGFFLWISMKDIDDTADFLTFCISKGVKFLPGDRCDAKKDGIINISDDGDCQAVTVRKSRSWMRLCFADLDVEELERGAKLLLSCYDTYIGGRKEDKVGGEVLLG